MTELRAFRQAAIAATTGDIAAQAAVAELGRAITAVILVEGVSDAAAIEALAELCGRDLDGAGVCVIPMAGVTNVAKFLAVLGPSGLGLRVAGLCDANEEPYVRRMIEGAGFGAIDSAQGMADAGFFVCVADLEDELIRALGVERVQQILDAQGDLRAFRTFQNQPAQRGRALDRQLRRFLGTTAGRKERYARILVEGLDPLHVPPPVGDVLRFATA